MHVTLPIQPIEKKYLILLGIGSAAALVAAFVAQFIFGLAPCHLCLLQRYPHAVVTIIALTGIRFLQKPGRLRVLLLLCIVALLVGAGIAGYHTGVEMRMFPGPSGCTSQNNGDESLDAMRSAIMNAPLVSCDQPLGKILGLSLAAWSLLIYVFLTIVASYGYYRVVSPVSSESTRKGKSHVA